MIWKNLILDFIKDNKKSIIIYFIIVFILFPTESLLLPKIYSTLFDKIEVSKITNLFSNINENIITLSSSGLMWSIIICWCLVIILYNIKDMIEADIIPKLAGYIRKKIFKRTLCTWR